MSKHLTKRELEVLVLITDGLSTHQIAERLHVSPRTVEAHRTRIRLKLDIGSVAGLVRYAVVHGLIQA